jgi:hypothetical protein
MLGADLKAVVGTDVRVCSGGVVVVVRLGRRPRTAPVLARYGDRLVRASTWAGERLLVGGGVARPAQRHEPPHRLALWGWRATPDRALPDASHLAVQGGRGDRAPDVHGRGRHHLLPASRGSRGHAPAGRRGVGRGSARRRTLSPGVLERLEEVVDASGVADRKRCSRSGCVPASSACTRSWWECSSPSPSPSPTGDRRPATGDRRPATGDRRPAHLTRIHAALVALPEAERWRLGVVVNWKAGPHLLSYR